MAGGCGGVLGSDALVAGVLGRWACSVMCSCLILIVGKDLSIVGIWREGGLFTGEKEEYVCCDVLFNVVCG